MPESESAVSSMLWSTYGAARCWRRLSRSKVTGSLGTRSRHRCRRPASDSGCEPNRPCSRTSRSRQDLLCADEQRGATAYGNSVTRASCRPPGRASRGMPLSERVERESAAPSREKSFPKATRCRSEPPTQNGGERRSERAPSARRDASTNGAASEYRRNDGIRLAPTSPPPRSATTGRAWRSANRC